MGQQRSREKKPDGQAVNPSVPHQPIPEQKRTTEQIQKDQNELDETFKQIALEREIQMPALSRVQREKFVELKALKQLFESGILNQIQYEASRDTILSGPVSNPDITASPFSPAPKRKTSEISSFAAFFNYAPVRYTDLIETAKQLGRDGVGEDWWNSEVSALPALNQCTIFLVRLSASLMLPWRTVVASMVMLHRYGRVLAKWASKTDAEAYLTDLSLPNRVIVASACVLLASKVEETLFSMRLLLLAIKQSLAGQFNNLLLAISQHGDPGKVVADRLATSIKQHEIDMLMRLGFDITVEHPHHYLPILARIVISEMELPADISSDSLTITAYMILDTCLPNAMWLFYPPQLMAIAALFVSITASTKHAKMNTETADPLPEFKFSCFNLEEDSLNIIRDVVRTMCASVQSAANRSEDFVNLCDTIGSIDWNQYFEDGPSAPVEYSPAACRDVSSFAVEETLDEGTYGCVSVARDTVTGETFALKLLKNTSGRSGFPYYMLRELLFLQRLNHKNVVHGTEIVVERKRSDVSSSSFSIVMEYVAYDLREVWFQQRDKSMKPKWTPGHIKHLMLQLLQGVAYMHQLGIMHRDIKLKNLLLGSDGTLKVADLGSIRETGRTQLKLTTQVVTLWYRPPELLLGATDYTSSIDMWSIGCVFVELLALKPPFPGYSVPEMMAWIVSVLGLPERDVWERCFARLPEADAAVHADRMAEAKSLRDMMPSISDNCLELINRMLEWDPSKRITAFEALNHPYFSEDPQPTVFTIEK